MMYKVKDMWLTKNRWSRPGRKNTVKFLVIHWTASAKGGWKGVFNFFENRKYGKTGWGSAHEMIDGDTVVRFIPSTEMAYHVGSSKYTKLKYKLMGKTYSNSLTYGIEVRVEDMSGNMSELTYETLINRAVDLLKEHNLGIESLLLHGELTGKNCHKLFMDNPQLWKEFKEEVDERINGKNTALNPIPQIVYRRLLRYKKPMLHGEDVKVFQRAMNIIGFNVGAEDGWLGSKTTKAIKELQRHMDAKVDGIVGKETYSKINKMLLVKSDKIDVSKWNMKENPYTYLIVEIQDPTDMYISEQNKSANSYSEKNCFTSDYQWDSGKTMYNYGVNYSNGKLINNNQPHGKPCGTVLVYDDEVKMKEILYIGNSDLKDLKFAVSGCQFYPKINMKASGFSGRYADIGRRTKRVMLGKYEGKLYMVAHPSINAGDSYYMGRYFGFEWLVTMDGGGSTFCRINGVDYYKTTRKLNELICIK